MVGYVYRPPPPRIADKGQVYEYFQPGKYLSTIIDEKSRKIFGYIISHKSDAAKHIMEWCSQAQVQTGKPLKQFHSDGGGEYSSTILLQYFKSKGIKVTKTVKATPQHNGIAERANRTIFEMARSMLYHAKLPVCYWEEAVMTAIYIRNRCITTADNKRTPEEIWSGKKPHIGHLRVFGCDAYVHVPDQDRTKLQSKSKKGIFIGYDETKQGYKVYDMEANKTIVSRDVLFNEHSFTFGRSKGKAMYMSPNVLVNESSTSYETELDTLIHSLTNSESMTSETSVASVPRPIATTTTSVNNSGLPQSQHQLLQEMKHDDDEPTDNNHDDDNNADHQHNNQPTNIDDDNAEHNTIPQQQSIPQRPRSTRPRKVPQRDFMVHHSQYALNAVQASEMPESEPNHYQEAVHSMNAAQWRQAMDEEMNALHQNNTWTLVALPPGRTAIGSKWVYKYKLNKDGAIERYKARFCAKGYSQVQGIDYNQTFAPVVKYKSLRIILALAAIKDYELTQMDVCTAFLNAEIKEQVYMKQPEGYEIGGDNMVCKLNKTLYGTKQAPHEWNEELNNFTLSLGFGRCVSDTCVYVKQSRTGQVMIISVFVDDILSAYATQDIHEWNQYKAQFMKQYKMKDLGECQWILGMRVQRNRNNKTLVLDQQMYLNKILKQFNMENCKASMTPEEVMKLSTQHSPTTQQQKNQIDLKGYQSMVGALMYASISTRPDIAHAVNMISRYLANPGQAHVTAAKRVLRYIKGTTDIGLVFKGTTSTDTRTTIIGNYNKSRVFRTNNSTSLY